MNRLYKEGDILTKGAHKFAPTDKHKTGGMSNEEFYAEFGSELLTFNGLDYSVNNHAPGARYMATGRRWRAKVRDSPVSTLGVFNQP